MCVFKRKWIIMSRWKRHTIAHWFCLAITTTGGPQDDIIPLRRHTKLSPKPTLTIGEVDTCRLDFTSKNWICFCSETDLEKKTGNSQRTCYAKHRAICLGLSNLPSGRKRRHAGPRARKSHEGNNSGKASAEKSSWHTGQHTHTWSKQTDGQVWCGKGWSCSE